MATTSKTRTTRRKAARALPTGARRIVDDVLSMAGTLARSRKDDGAEKLQTIARSTRDFAASMTDLPSLKAHAATAADSIEGLAEYVIHTDMEKMVADAGALARRYPFAALAATVAAGIAASRYLMPSAKVVTAAPSRRKSPKRAAVPALRKRAMAAKPASNGRAHAEA